MRAPGTVVQDWERAWGQERFTESMGKGAGVLGERVDSGDDVGSAWGEAALYLLLSERVIVRVTTNGLQDHMKMN